METVIYSIKTTLKVKCVHSQLAELMYLTISFAYEAQRGPSCKNAAARIESLACVRKKTNAHPSFHDSFQKKSQETMAFSPYEHRAYFTVA